MKLIRVQMLIPFLNLVLTFVMQIVTNNCDNLFNF